MLLHCVWTHDFLCFHLICYPTFIVNGNRPSCKDGKCRARKGHTRKMWHISDESQSCEHIRLLNNNTEQWLGLLADISMMSRLLFPITLKCH